MTGLARYLFGKEAAMTIPTRTFDGEHWFMAAIICDLLGISNHSQAVRDYLDDDEWRKETIYIGGRHGKKHVLLINNSGMLKLIRIGRSVNAGLVRERATIIPDNLKPASWPSELNVAA
jgi:prophage antirepressor-like protein